jgi:peptidoglycan/xylan/chitin deacetylase (PgdA/CDA1 family)
MIQNDKSICEGNPHAIKVLMYHRIVDDERLSRASWTCVHLREFRRQLHLLDRWGFTPITFEDYRLFINNELNLPRKPIIITFDDGYLDTYKFAFPLMKEFGMKGVIFVLGDRNIKTNSWDKSHGIHAAPLMEGYQIVEMHAAGFEIGAHSMSHAKLPLLPKDKAWEEISRSRIVLEILLNASVRTFSYPYGLLNKMAEKMVANAGFTLACSVYTGPAAFGVEPYQIRRIAIRSSTGPLAFGTIVQTPYQYYEWLRWKVRNAIFDLKDRRNGYPLNFDEENAHIPNFTKTTRQRWRNRRPTYLG